MNTYGEVTWFVHNYNKPQLCNVHVYIHIIYMYYDVCGSKWYQLMFAEGCLDMVVNFDVSGHWKEL